MEESLAPALRRLAKRIDLLSFGFRHPADGSVGHFFQEEIVNRDLLIGIEHQTLGREIVSAGAPHFLIILLYGARHIHVDNEADVRLMNSHSKGHRGHHEKPFSMEKFMLRFRSLPI